MKNHLIINQYAPLNGLYSEEILELALSIASLEHELSILLLKDAGLQLLKDQNYNLIARHLLEQTIKAFALFEFKNIYLEIEVYKQLKILNLTIDPIFNNKILNFDLKNLTDLSSQYDTVWFF